MKYFFLSLLGILFILPEVSALNPSRTYRQNPEQYNMDYKAYRVKTNDGKAALNAWHFPAKIKTTSLVLIAHNGEGNMADYLRRVDQFRQFSNVLIFDYRGFGESSDFKIDNEMYIYPHFQDDLSSMIEFATKTFSGDVTLYGWGIGAGLSLGIGYHHTDVKKIIADTPFLSMEDLESRFEANKISTKVPLKGMKEMFQPSYALRAESGNSNLKILIMVASEDELIAVKDMKNLMDMRPKQFAALQILENSKGGDNFRNQKAEYMNGIKRFMEKG